MKRKPNVYEAIRKCKENGLDVIQDRKTREIYVFDEWYSYKAFIRLIESYFKKRWTKAVKNEQKRSERARSKHMLNNERFDLLNKEVGYSDPWDFD